VDKFSSKKAVDKLWITGVSEGYGLIRRQKPRFPGFDALCVL